ncbi:uncharacterized protein, partial [Malus domestica]|uniref:uncharacterized protein n=1 Tax=Malus domestica TaxID=3750 RepID=UPI003975A5D0
SDKEKNHFLAFDLMEGINVHAIEAKIAKYQEENAEQIMINKARKIVQNKIAVFFTLIYDMAGELAAALAASKGHPLQNETDAGVSQGSQAGFGAGRQGAGRRVERRDEQEEGGRAGGWSGEISRKRALEEAYSSVWIC